MAGYKYGGTGRTMTDAEVAERLKATRAQAAANINGAPPSSPAARAAAPAPALKGAVKVEGFPAQSQFPFREIAADGGVWKLDPAAFTWRGKPVKPQSIRTAASKYATEHGMKAKTVIKDGHLYVQFK